MMGSSRWRPSGHLAAASLTLAALVVLSSGEARAGCHYPWVKAPLAHGRLVALEILDEASGPGRSNGESPAPAGPSPCARGACAPAPVIPVSSSGPSPRRADLWGLAIHVPLPSANPTHHGPPGRNPARPLHRTVPVERPPR